jgi:uroporphyrinogen-III synthase
MNQPKETIVLYTGTRAPDPIPAGLSVRHLPMLEVEPVPDIVEPLDQLVDTPVGLVVYSKNAIRCLRRAGAHEPLTPFDRHVWWAVGEQTADAMHNEFGIRVHYPSRQNFEGLKSDLEQADLPERVVALSLEGKSRDLSPILTPRRIEFVDFPVYRTVPSEQPAAADELAGADWLVFTSSRGVETFFDQPDADRLAELAGAICTAAIGPRTAETAREHGLVIDEIPETPGTTELLEMIAARNLE